MDGDGLRTTLSTGLRALDADGKPNGNAVGIDALVGMTSLLVVDLEMSGPNAQMHEVLDLGGVRAQLAPGLTEEEAYGAKVRPKHIGNAVLGALKVTGYSPKAWKSAVEIEEAVEKFTAIGRGAVVTGWGIGQDMAFLVETYKRLNQPWPFALLALDVQPIARVLLKDGAVDRFNLGHVADRLGIGRMGEHGALADAYATYDVLVKLMERAGEMTAQEEQP